MKTFKILAIVLILALVAFLPNFGKPWMRLVMGIPVGLLLVVALFFIGMVKVKEATGTALEFLGGYCGSVMNLKDSHFGEGEFIEDSPGSKTSSTCKNNWFIWRIFGLVLYIKWFVSPTKYTDQNDKDGFGENYSVFLNEVQKEIHVEKAETGSGNGGTGDIENIPLNVSAVYKVKIVNLYLFLFKAPKDAIVQINKEMDSNLRALIRKDSYNKVQEYKSKGKRLWEDFGTDITDAIKRYKDAWGIEIIEDGISITDVGLQKDDQDAFKQKKRQKLLTAARAQEVLGGMLENEAMRLGVTDGDAARKELENTPEGKDRLLYLNDEANRIANQRVRNLRPVVFENADGTNIDPSFGTIASLISLATGAASPPQSPLTTEGDPSSGDQTPAKSDEEGKPKKKGGGNTPLYEPQ